MAQLVAQAKCRTCDVLCFLSVAHETGPKAGTAAGCVRDGTRIIGAQPKAEAPTYAMRFTRATDPWCPIYCPASPVTGRTCNRSASTNSLGFVKHAKSSAKRHQCFFWCANLTFIFLGLNERGDMVISRLDGEDRQRKSVPSVLASNKMCCL